MIVFSERLIQHVAKNDSFLSLKADSLHILMSSQDCLYLTVKLPQHDNL